MQMALSHQDEMVARGFFADNHDAFDHWVTRKDKDTDHFAGAAEAAALFVLFCGALSQVSGAMDNIDKITKHAKKLIAFSKDLLQREEEDPKTSNFKLSERLLVLIFDNYMRSGKGLPTARLVTLTGANEEEVEKELKRFETGGVIRKGKSGWLVAQ